MGISHYHYHIRYGEVSTYTIAVPFQVELPVNSLVLLSSNLWRHSATAAATTLSQWLKLKSKPLSSSALVNHNTRLTNYLLPISPRSSTTPVHQPLPPPHNAYGDAAVNFWSKEIVKYIGFVFLTLQYNLSFPAAVKCAVDHLFHERVAKPALIVSYRKTGRSKANAHLRQALLGVRMSALERTVKLSIIVRNGPENSNKGILDCEVLEAWNSGERNGELLPKWKGLVFASKYKGEEDLNDYIVVETARFISSRAPCSIRCLPCCRWQWLVVNKHGSQIYFSYCCYTNHRTAPKDD